MLLAGGLLLAVSCATTPKAAETAPPRMKDSAPEKAAAQRAAAAHELQLEQDDERWGIEAAKERKREQQEARDKRGQQPAGAKDVTVTPPAR